jgi:hypothetical protein
VIIITAQLLLQTVVAPAYDLLELLDGGGGFLCSHLLAVLAVLVVLVVLVVLESVLIGVQQAAAALGRGRPSQQEEPPWYSKYWAASNRSRIVCSFSRTSMRETRMASSRRETIPVCWCAPCTTPS